MRALLLVPVAVTAFAAACSGPGSETTANDSSFESELELAIFSGRAETTPVLAEEELHRPETSQPAARVAPVPGAAARAPVAVEASLLGEPVVARLASDEPQVMAPTVDSGDLDVSPVAIRGSAVADEEGDAGEVEAAQPTTRGRGIIIRGGVSGRDPCKLHLPGSGGIAGVLSPGGMGRVLGTVGVMVNDRAPRLSGDRRRAPDRRPAGPMMGGSVFRSSIR
jgi:hypothetical protein